MSVHPFPEPVDSVFGIIETITGIAVSAFGDVTVGELLEAIKDVPLKDVIAALLNEEEDVA